MDTTKKKGGVRDGGGSYLLWYAYELKNGCGETKMLGVFSSEEKAREAVALRRNGTEREGGPLCH